jgi:ribosome-associated protein
LKVASFFLSWNVFNFALEKSRCEILNGFFNEYDNTIYAMEEFSIHTEFIELNKLLKIMHWVETGGQANQSIEEGLVKVNGQPEFRKRNKIRPGDVIIFNEKFSVKITGLPIL